jgi:hypothetical protein
MTPFALSTSALTPYSGDSQNPSKTSTESPVQSQSNMDYGSLMKKDKIAAGGDLLTGALTVKNPWPKPSNSAVTTETLRTQISPSPLTKQKNEHLLHWLNSFPHTLPNPSSIPSTDYLHWLLECHKSQQLPLSLQQAHWAELLDLEYPLEQEASLGTSLEEAEGLEEDCLVVEDLLMMEDLLKEENPPIQTETLELEEGEIPQTLEEGEILLTADSLINY